MKKLILTLIIALTFTRTTFASDQSAGKNNIALNDYLEIQTLLAKDTFKGVTEAAKKFISDSKTFTDPQISESAKPLVNAKNLVEARTAFEPLSKTMRNWAKKTHPKGMITAYCPMKKAYWVQTKGDIRNPFYGSEMLECGVAE